MASRNRNKTGRKRRSEKTEDVSDIDKKTREAVSKAPKGVSETKHKPGRFGSKTQQFEYKKAKSKAEIEAAKRKANLQSKLQKGESILLAPFLGESKSGLYTQKDLKDAASKISSKMPGEYFIKSVSRDDSGDLTVKGDYRKAGYKFDPRASKLESTGWKLDIPDTFKKVDDTTYKAPPKEFESWESYDYRREYDDGDRQRYRDKSSGTGKYSPTVLKLSEEGDKLRQVLEFGDYESRKESESYEREEDDYEIKEYERDKERDVFKREVQDFYDTGIMKGIEKYGPYTKKSESEEYERERRDKEIERDEDFRVSDIYKKLDVDYDPEGRSAREREWDLYREDERRKELEEMSKETESREYSMKPYLSKDIEFDEGLRTREQRWKSYTPYEREETEDRWGRYREDVRTRGDVMKSRDVEYEQGAPVSTKEFGVFESERTDKESGPREDVRVEREPFLQREVSYWEPGVKKESAVYKPYEGYTQTTSLYEETDAVPSGQGPIDVTGREYAYDRNTGQIVFYDSDERERTTERGVGPSRQRIYGRGGELVGQLDYGKTGTEYTEFTPSNLSVEASFMTPRQLSEEGYVGVKRGRGRGGFYYDQLAGDRSFVDVRVKRPDYGRRMGTMYNPTTGERTTINY